MRKMVKGFNNAVGIGILILMGLMVVAALHDMNRGSLDDLPADEIRDVVDKVMQHGS